jgi:hypothetical protein
LTKVKFGRDQRQNDVKVPPAAYQTQVERARGVLAGPAIATDHDGPSGPSTRCNPPGTRARRGGDSGAGGDASSADASSSDVGAGDAAACVPFGADCTSGLCCSGLVCFDNGTGVFTCNTP